MDELETLREENRQLLRENRELRIKVDMGAKRHLTVPEVAKLYGYTAMEIRRLAIVERKLRFIPSGSAKGVSHCRIRFDRFMVQEDFEDMVISSRERRAALIEKNRPRKRFIV